MDSDLLRRGLRLLTFCVLMSLSLMCTICLFSLRLGRALVGLALFTALAVAVLYVAAKYLAALWLFSNRIALIISGEKLEPVPTSEPQRAEQLQ